MKRSLVAIITSMSLVLAAGLVGCDGFPLPDGRTIPTIDPTPTADPVFSPSAGTYPNAVDVTITSATQGAAIYYTTDKAAPSDTARPYIGPIHLAASATVRAIAYKLGMLPSQIVETSYTIQTGPRNQSPQGSNPTAAGTPFVGQASPITVSCQASDADGTVQSVVADLSQLGAPTSQPLTQDGTNTWTWTGSVTPNVNGSRTVRFVITDNSGAASTTSTTINVLSANDLEKWHFQTGDWIWSSPALASDGTIYVGSLDGKVYAITPQGQKKWEFATGSYVYASPAVAADGTIYVGSRDFQLYALNPDGTKKWEFAGSVDSSPALAQDGTIYIGSTPATVSTGSTPTPGEIYALNPDGSPKWAFMTNGPIWSSAAIAATGNIYVGCRDYNLYAIDPTGYPLWHVATSGQVNSSPAIGSDGTIYVGSADHNLYAIQPDGSPKWHFTATDAIDASPAIAADGTIYAGSSDGHLYAIDPQGSLKWAFAAAGPIDSSPAIGSDGTIYVGSADGKVYAIKPDGSPAWSFATGGPINSSPVLASDGTLYVGSDDGRLYALRAFTGAASSPWPMFRRDLTHTGRSPASQPTNQPPQITNITVTVLGGLMEGIPNTLTISCTASDNEGTVTTVEADLSTIGVTDLAQFTSYDGTNWNWYGFVYPMTAGSLPVTLKAIDDMGAASTFTTNITVAAAQRPPQITNITVTPLDGPLTVDQNNMIEVRCNAYDPDPMDAVTSVAVDLKYLGGPSNVAMYYNPDTD